MSSLEDSPPRILVISSWTILTICWPGLRLSSTSVPTDRSLTRWMKSRATLKLTSASSRARRTSRRPSSTSFSVRRPLLVKRLKTPFSFSESASNISCSLRIL